MNPTRRQVLAVSAGAAAATLPTFAFAQFPDKPIRLIVPYTPGGPASLIGRFLQEKLGQTLGQPVVVEHKPGAGLSVGAQFVATSPKDGYTLLLGAASMLVPTGGSTRTPADNLRDFAPISLVGGFPLVLVSSPKLEAKTVQELIQYTRANPGKVNYGSSGIGSLTHLGAAMFEKMANVDMVHVPYRGISEALVDISAERVQLAFAGAPAALPLVAQGRLRALGVTSSQRTASAPQLPTIAESGVAGYDLTPWYGIMTPTGTPPAVMSRLHAEITRTMQSQDVKDKWKEWGADALFSRTPDEFGGLMKREADKWAALVKAGVKLE